MQLPADHQCARLHGHNYVVVIELSGAALNTHGFVRDYHELSPLKHYIDSEFDHRHLNDVLADDMVTAVVVDLVAVLWPTRSL